MSWVGSHVAGQVHTLHVHVCDLLVNTGVEPFVTHPHMSFRQLQQIAKSDTDQLCRLLVRTAELSALQQQTSFPTSNHHSTHSKHALFILHLKHSVNQSNGVHYAMHCTSFRQWILTANNTDKYVCVCTMCCTTYSDCSFCLLAQLLCNRTLIIWPVYSRIWLANPWYL